jgi:hypothetical protein
MVADMMLRLAHDVNVTRWRHAGRTEPAHHQPAGRAVPPPPDEPLAGLTFAAEDDRRVSLPPAKVAAAINNLSPAVNAEPARYAQIGGDRELLLRGLGFGVGIARELERTTTMLTTRPPRGP